MLPRQLAAFLLALLACAPCLAAGPWLAESGGADVGMAGAGRAALAQDGSALASNPAAMAALEGSTVSIAAMPLQLDYEFRGLAASSPAHATNHEDLSVIPAAYAVRRAGGVSYGAAIYSPLGLGFDSGPQWAGRRVIEQARLGSLNVMAAAAWPVTDKLSLGGSAGGQWLRPQARIAVASDAIFYGPPAGWPDGAVTLDGDSWGFAAQLGATYALSDQWRVGMTWTAPVDHTVAFDVHGKGLHPTLALALPASGSVRLDATVPQQVLVGLARESKGTTWALGAVWQDWSQFGAASLSMPGYAAPMFAAGLRDTWGASAGVRHDFGDGWTASTGVSYESNPATAAGIPAYFPVAEQWRIAAGVERSLGDALRLRAAASIVLQGDAVVVQDVHPLPLPGIPPLHGEYRDTQVALLALGADFRL